MIPILLLGFLLAFLVLALWAAGQVFPSRWARVVRVFFLLLLVVTVLGLWLGPKIWVDLLGVPGRLLQAATILFVTELLFDVLVLLGWGWEKLCGLRGRSALIYSPSRRRLLKHAAAYPLAALAAGLYGGLYEKDATVEREILVPVMNLPATLRGLRVAQLSDVHLGWFLGLDELKALLERTAAGKPDVLVITGDLFDNRRLIRDAAALVDGFVDAFPLGIWYIFGNHEHYRGIDEVRAALAGTRVHLLDNEAAVVPGAEPLYFAGVDYPFSKGEKFQQEKAALTKQAFAKIPEGAVTIFLAHHPEFIDDGAARGAALTLTGHTHGCQFCVFGRPLFPMFKYNRGLVKVGDSTGYVHSGNGSWFPYRIGCPPEIAYFTLRRG